MQRLAPKPERRGERGARPCGHAPPAAVHRIADQRIAEVRQMHADLMRAPGLKLHGQQGVGARSARRMRKCVTAARPSARTAMRVRWLRWRPIGSSTVPPPVMTPVHSAT